MSPVRSPWHKNFIFIFILGVVLLSVFVGNVLNAEEIRGLAAVYGYGGVFLASVLSGFNVVVPIPIILFLPAFVELGLKIAPTFILIVLGMTCGDTLGYAIGKAGRLALTPRNQRIQARLEKIRERYRLSPLLVLFLFVSLVPFPNEVIAIPLGFLGYRPAKIIPILLAGNTMFNALVAFGLFNLWFLVW